MDICKNLPYHVLNVNIPDVGNADAIIGRKITSLGHSQIERPVRHVVDPRGRDGYWLSLRKRQLELPSDTSIDTLPPQQVMREGAEILLATKVTDSQAITAGYISLSPVRLHHTSAAMLDTLSALAL